MNQGSDISVVLPFVTRVLSRASPRPVTDREAQLAVLVIDGSPEDRMRLRGALAGSGVVLDEAVDAKTGIQHVISQTPDCILLDHRLQDHDGLAVIERLRRPDGHLPCAVIILTDSLDTAIATAAIEAGAFDSIAKDQLAADELLGKIAWAVREHRQLAEHRFAREQNAHLASIIAASGDGIVSIAPDAVHIKSWSPGATQIFGYAEAEAVGRSIEELIVPDHLKEERARLYAAAKSERHTVLVETMRRHKSGQLIPVEVNVAPIIGADGDVTGYSVIFRDITERRKTEARLASIRDALSSENDRGLPQDLLAETRATVASANSPTERLAAVRTAELLDAPTDSAFDQVTRLVCGILQAPVSLLTVVDSDRSFFVSSYGLPEPWSSSRQTPLSSSYCRHVIDSGEPLVVHDAETNPIVSATGTWRDGFIGYLGVPIRDRNGVVVASLCAADSKVRAWTRQELLSLEGLARLTMRELENRAIRRELEASERFSRAVLESSPDCVKVIDRDGRLQYMNHNGTCLFEIDDFSTVRGERWAALWPAETRPAIEQAVADGLQGKPARFEAFCPTVKGQPRWWDVIVDPVQSPSNLSGQLISVSRDITERKRTENALRASEERFRTFVTTAQEGIWAIDTKGRTTFVNPRLAELLGTDPGDMADRPLTDFCFAEDVGEIQGYVTGTLAGRSQEFEGRFRRTDGTPLHLLCATSPLCAADGEVTGVLGGFLNLAERKRAEERQQLMMRELSHRGKNLLAVVQSIANRSMSNDRSVAEAREVFSGRLGALANSYGVLTDEAFEGAPLDTIIGTELKPFSGRTDFDGPRIILNAPVAQSMSLVVHELATNASKYGALSVPTGRLTVAWRVEGSDPDRRFVFEWQESGGPPVSPPNRRGFGTTLVTSVAGVELKCTPELAYDEAGFRYRFDAPLRVVGSVVEESPVRQRLHSDEMRALYDAWTGLKGRDGRTPIFKHFDPTGFVSSGRLSIAEVHGDDDVRFVEVGDDLKGRLRSVVGPAQFGSETTAIQKASYLRCARENAPSYEHARFKFGDGDNVRFERLLVPFSLSGDRVSHIVGLIVFTGNNQTTDG